MLDREKNGRISPEIYVYATNKNFLNIYDALRIDKIKVEIAGYDPNTKRQTGHASAWLDRADARLLTHLISNRLFAPVTGGKWEKFGGSQREDSSIESRTLVVEWDEGDGGRFARFPYRITISNGPGVKTDMGAVKPAGEPTSRISMRLSETDMIKIMLSIGSYMTAYETAHHHRLVADKLRELEAKLADRAVPQSRPEPSLHTVPTAPARAAAPRTQQPERGNGGGISTYDRPPRVATSPAASRPPLRSIDGGQASQPRVGRAG